MLMVVDTKILVSTLWIQDGAPAKVISLILNETLVPCYNRRIMGEYTEVLERTKFDFSKTAINSLLELSDNIGRSLLQSHVTTILLTKRTRNFVRLQNSVMQS